MGSESLAWLEPYDELRSRIKSGELRAEAVLDRSVLTADVSIEVFNQALEQLANEGLLQRDASQQLTVAQPRARSKRSTSFQEDYISQGRRPSIKTQCYEVRALDSCPEFVRETFSGTDCAMLARHYHVQSVDGEPHAICDSFYPYEIVGKHWKDIREGSTDAYAVLKDGGYVATEKQETLFVDSPTLPERELLGIAKMPAVAVVRLNCIVWSKAQIMEACILCDRADLYEFTYRVGV